MLSGSKGLKAMNVLKPLATLLADLLIGVQDSLIDKANQLFKKDGVMRCMLIGRTNEAVGIIRGWNSLPASVVRRFSKTDFSTSSIDPGTF